MGDAVERWRLFCVPHAGGIASAFTPLARMMPPSVAVMPVELAGRGKRSADKPHDRIGPLIDDLCERFAGSFFAETPFALFGHSMGALVVFELARALRSRRLAMPQHLFVSGCPSAEIPARIRCHDASDERLVEVLREYAGTDDEVLADPSAVATLLPMIRADFAVCETYVCRAENPLPTPITALAGLRDPDVDAAGLEAWSRHTASDFASFRFPGDHFYFSAPSARLANVIVRRLAVSGSQG